MTWWVPLSIREGPWWVRMVWRSTSWLTWKPLRRIRACRRLAVKVAEFCRRHTR